MKVSLRDDLYISLFVVITKLNI